VAVEEWERLHPSSMHGVGSGLLSSVFGSVAAVSESYLAGVRLSSLSPAKIDQDSR